MIKLKKRNSAYKRIRAAMQVSQSIVNNSKVKDQHAKQDLALFYMENMLISS